MLKKCLYFSGKCMYFNRNYSISSQLAHSDLVMSLTDRGTVL